MGLDTWEHDLRYALRRLLRKPAFSLLVVLTLGLGFGANTAVFSVMHSVLLEPLPFEAPQELVRIYAVDRDARGDGGFLSAPSTLHIRDASATLAGIAMLENYAAKGVDITEGDRPERARMLRVPEGEVTLTASKGGYDDKIRVVTVSPGQTTTVDFALAPP